MDIPLEAETGDGEDTSFVDEADEILSIVSSVVTSEGVSAEAHYDRWKAILSKYQEQSQLLDAYLEGIVVPLSTLMRAHALSDGSLGVLSDPSLSKIQGVCRLLSVLVVVRGYKTVVKFFPHEAQDLERVLSVLIAVKGRPGRSGEEGIASWECQSILLLWLSMLILVPFDLSTIDSSATDLTALGTQPYTLLVSKLMNLCQEYLYHPGTVRDMAALLLGRMLTRPDMNAALGVFITWVEEALGGVKESLDAMFVVPGALLSLCFAFKLGQRARLLPYANRVWNLLLGPLVLGNDKVSESILARKLSNKLIQRLALTFLEPRLAPWRYKREGALDVERNLLGEGEGGAEEDKSETPVEDEEFELAEEVEEVVERLLAALTDKDTVVRWSAAKGIGRVTGCLPQDLADDVVGQVLELFRPTESDAAWHGGCLALAELARRGLLLPEERLPGVTHIVQRALQYDIRRGPHSIGTHVRDAAAYVCWACSRAYEPHLMEGSVQVLASSLLVVACFDREINCRRAAAAAFQEAVGRLGTFPHGMEIIAVADYFAVGNINQAYLKVAPFVGSFVEYKRALAEHLLHVKLRHWEKSLRELAARGCSALVPCFGEFFANEAIDFLLPGCLDSVLEVRHGALMGLSELLPSLKAAGIEVSESRLSKVADLVSAIDKARLYRGKGGEVMREAVGHLIASSSRVSLVMNKTQKLKAMEAMDENLKHPQPYIRRAAVVALGEFAKAYASVKGEDQSAFRERQVKGFMSRLHDPNVAIRRGSASGIGVLPEPLIRPLGAQVLEALIDGLKMEEDPDERDVESRVNCAEAIGSVSSTLTENLTTVAKADEDKEPGLSVESALDLMYDRVIPALHEALGDYTTDNRGDVGSLVREEAMSSLVRVLCIVARLEPLSKDGQVAVRLTPVVCKAASCILKQAVERIGRIREAASKSLESLLSDPVLSNLVPASTVIASCIARDDKDLLFLGPVELVTRLSTRILPLQDPLVKEWYVGPILEGLVASIGGFEASLSKASSTGLVQALSSNDQGGGELLQLVAARFVNIWARQARTARMSVPLLRSAELLVSRVPEILRVKVPHPDSQEGTNDGLVPFPEALVTLARAETRLCSDVMRLLDIASLLCHLLPHCTPLAPQEELSDEGHKGAASTITPQGVAMQGLFLLLVNKYPRVRRHSSEQLYIQLLTLDLDQLCLIASASILEDAALERVQEILISTAWDGDIDSSDGARVARDTIAQMLKLPVPATKAPGGSMQTKRAQDENASYGTLLQDFERGV